jgi:acetyl-CoA C-acetyltransferase
VIKAVCARSGVDAGSIQEVYMGNVLSANIGQAPARQAALHAGLPDATVCTGINKVCASGMKAAIIATQQIELSLSRVVLAGGMESMTNVPYYLPKARFGARMGDSVMVDGMVKDGLWDPYHEFHMGMCAEECATKHDISRADQDAHAFESYRRSRAATEAGAFAHEIAPVIIDGRKGQITVDSDEEVQNDPERLALAKPAFKRDGTVTAGNSSTLSDGAAAILLVSGAEAKAQDLPVLARIVGYGEAAQVRPGAREPRRCARGAGGRVHGGTRGEVARSGLEGCVGALVSAARSLGES